MPAQKITKEEYCKAAIKSAMNDQRLTELSRDICRIIADYLRDESHKKEFEEWYLKKYGKPYAWKGVKK